jgi:hypothetical protein
MATGDPIRRAIEQSLQLSRYRDPPQSSPSTSRGASTYRGSRSAGSIRHQAPQDAAARYGQDSGGCSHLPPTAAAYGAIPKIFCSKIIVNNALNPMSARTYLRPQDLSTDVSSKDCQDSPFKRRIFMTCLRGDRRMLPCFVLNTPRARRIRNEMNRA